MKLSEIKNGEHVYKIGNYFLTIEREHDNENLFMLGLIDCDTNEQIDSGIGYDSVQSIMRFIAPYVNQNK